MGNVQIGSDIAIAGVGMAVAGAAGAGKGGGLAKASRGQASSPEKLYHYIDQKGHDGILESQNLRAFTKEKNPKDVRYGDGQYLTDITPGSKTLGQLSRAFVCVPYAGQKYTHFVEIDVRGLNVVEGRPGVFVIPNSGPP
jgi:hypothetical protein